MRRIFKCLYYRDCYYIEDIYTTVHVNKKKLPKVGLNLDFSSKKMLIAGLHELALFNCFDGQDKARLVLSSEIHVTEFPIPKFLPNLEVR